MKNNIICTCSRSLSDLRFLALSLSDAVDSAAALAPAVAVVVGIASESDNDVGVCVTGDILGVPRTGVPLAPVPSLLDQCLSG